MIKYFIAWFPMLLIAIGNGTLRDLFYKKYTGELVGHQLSTIFLIALFAMYIGFIINNFRPSSAKQCWLIGSLWMILTVFFEFGFGRFRGRSWEYLLADYNVFQGRIWILIPIWLFISPYLFCKIYINN